MASHSQEENTCVHILHKSSSCFGRLWNGIDSFHNDKICLMVLAQHELQKERGTVRLLLVPCLRKIVVVIMELCICQVPVACWDKNGLVQELCFGY